MGYFNWKTSDTKKTIWNINSRYGAKPSPVYLITEDGRHWAENKYDGYGVFGGKDIYVLIAELNGFKPKKEQNEEDARDWAFNNVFATGDTSFTNMANKGFKMPKIVEKLPSKEKWVAMWTKLPYPANAENQGYFKDGGKVDVGNFDVRLIVSKDGDVDSIKQIASKCGGKLESKQKANTLLSLNFSFDKSADSSNFIKDILAQRNDLSIEDILTYSDELKRGGGIKNKDWDYTIGGL